MALKNNVIANYVGHGWVAIMGLAFVPWYIKYLGIESFGLIGLFSVMQAWLTLLDMGMTPTLNREMARFTSGAQGLQSIHDLLRSLEMITACIAVFITVSIGFSAGYLATGWLKAEDLPIPVVTQALSIMGFVVALRFVEGIYRGSLLGLQRQIWFNVVNAAIATLRYGGAVFALAWIAPTIQTFFLWQAAVSLLSVTILAIGVHKALPVPPVAPAFKIEAIAGVWKFAGGMMLVTFLAILLTQLDKVLLSRLLSLGEFGLYTLAATVAGALYILIAPITTAVYPRLVELLAQENLAELKQLYHQGAQLVTLLVAPLVMLLYFFSKEILFVWSGNPSLAESTAPVLSVLVLGAFLNGLMYMPAQLQLAYGWVGLGIKTNLVAVLVLAPAIFWVVPRYGAIGAAWIWVILNAGYVLIAIQLMHRRLLASEKWKWYLSDVMLPAVGPAAVMFLARQFHSAEYLDRWSELVFLLAAGLLALAASSMSAGLVRPKLLAFCKA